MARVSLEGRRISFTVAWTAEDFTRALLRNSHAFLKTRPVELAAIKLVQNKFPEADCMDFLKSVCRWGNRAGTAGLVSKNNSRATIQRQMLAAWAALQEDRISDALAAMTALNGLDVSFGSKHLRMLAPSKAVVLDSIIDFGLGYGRTATGYEEFLSDCISIRDFLNGPGGSINPVDLDGPWRVADVEMAIYSKLRGL